MNIEIANRLVQLRKANNLSQEALAGKLGLSRQAISKWERAEASPDTDNLILLARIYGVSLDELLKTQEDIIVEEVALSVPGQDQTDYVYEDNHAVFLDFPVALVITIVYILVGTFWHAWHPGWILFLIIPLWYSLISAVEYKNMNYFAYPVLTTIIYLLLGCFYDLWYYGWVIYLTIPIYYYIAGFLKR